MSSTLEHCILLRIPDGRLTAVCNADGYIRCFAGLDAAMAAIETPTWRVHFADWPHQIIELDEL